MRSKFERRIADSLEKRGISYEYESLQLEYYTRVRGGQCTNCGSSKHIAQQHWYTPDFIIPVRGDSTLQSGVQCKRDDADSKLLIVEAKGRFTSVDRTKMKQVKEAHPEEDIRFVFMSNNKIHKNSDMRYGDWCDRHGFPWAIGDIPNEWLKER